MRRKSAGDIERLHAFMDNDHALVLISEYTGAYSLQYPELQDLELPGGGFASWLMKARRQRQGRWWD